MKKKLIAPIIALIIMVALIGWWIGPQTESFSEESESSNGNLGSTEENESSEIIEMELRSIISLGYQACTMETLFRDAPAFAPNYTKRDSEEFEKIKGEVVRTTGSVEGWKKHDELEPEYPLRIDLSYRIEVYGVNKPGGTLYVFVPQSLFQKVQNLNLRWLDKITIEGEVLGYTSPYLETPVGTRVMIELTKIVKVEKQP